MTIVQMVYSLYSKKKFEYRVGVMTILLVSSYLTIQNSMISITPIHFISGSFDKNEEADIRLAPV